MNRKCKIERKNKREVFTFLLDPLSRVSKKKRKKKVRERFPVWDTLSHATDGETNKQPRVRERERGACKR
jgi:hypothetical protein